MNCALQTLPLALQNDFTVLDVGRGKLTPADIDRLYEIKDRFKPGPQSLPRGW